MKNFTIGVIAFLISFTLTAQLTAEFENFGLEAGEFINNDTTGLGFKTGLVSLPNLFNSAYGSFSGWAISSMTDTETPGFTNQFSSIVGSGFDGSTSYGVTFEFAEGFINVENEGVSATGVVEGMYVTNNTFAFLSMLEGDAFAKKFGGETGEDPDFFSIVFRGVTDGVASSDSLEFFLADFRSDISSEDFILDEWAFVDLSDFGAVNAISYSFRSSDVGVFGINTPTYFCADNITVELNPLNTSYQSLEDIKVYPTLVEDNIIIELSSQETANLELVSIIGLPITKIEFTGGKVDLNISQIPSGNYFVRILQGDAIGTKKLVKL